ncbi:MAG TPA: pyrroloquinoline quinone biosynthesis protein PqqE [Steroidobacteraceae bacterium]|nr:pyrroloquinoline quinone biosynthesis protein PqqE [Steroidobacteraceae bacterium]
MEPEPGHPCGPANSTVPGAATQPAIHGRRSGRDDAPRPLWLLLELTYRCPLHCVFCYNPTDFATTGPELATQDWIRVLHEARALGAVQLGLSGGEPLARDDLEVIVAEAHSLGFYSNLITSGIGMTEVRIAALKEAGLDHIQLSFQDSSREMNDFLSSTRTFELKSKVAGLIRKYEYPMVLNCVLHRLNIEHVEEILELAERMGAEYVELANTQYYGWAWLNRAHLMPTREQLRKAEETLARFRARPGMKMKIFFVVPDYFETRPKACMNGLGSVFLTVTPDGTALPCHAARMLPGLTFPNVATDSVKSIWQDSAAFNHFRGTDWMKEPCRSCPEKTRDFGGCRCQAYLLTGDAANADPVCDLSPHHHLVQEAVAAAAGPISSNDRQVAEKSLIYRDHRISIPVVVVGARAPDGNRGAGI